MLLALLLFGSFGCERLITRPSLYGTVTAVVTRRDSTPIPGAELVLYTGQRPMGYGTTDSAGRYRFEEVPEGAYGVLATPPAGYVRLETLLPTNRPSESVDGLSVAGGKTFEARIRFLQVGPGTISAQVREPNGTTIPGLSTILYAPRGEVRRALTDTGGRVVFREVPFGIYGVAVERPALYRDSGEVALPFRDGLIVEAGASESAAFTFERCLGSLVAQVADQSGRPVPGSRLVLYNADSTLARDSVSAVGSRTFGGLLCGGVGVRVVVPRGYVTVEQRGSAFVDGLRIRRNAQVPALLTVQRLPRAAVRVVAVDQDSRPVAEARVLLYTGQGVVRDTRTGQDGVVTLDTILMTEPHGVRVAAPRGYVLTEGRGSSFVDQLLLADGETRTLTFRLQRAGRATVQVAVLADNDQPVAGARVTLYTSTGVERETVTGADGRVTFAELFTDGEYGVRVAAPAGFTIPEGRDQSFVDGVRLADGETRTLTFRARRTP